MMEVDQSNWRTETDTSCPELGKYSLMKSFVVAARDFLATHNELSLNAMNRNLGLLASTMDPSIFAPGRIEVCSFYNSLWSVMNEKDGPHWAGISCLARALTVPTARAALTQTYRFMPILSKLLADSLSFDHKCNLLHVMQDVSYNTKITWQEFYIHKTVKILTEWIYKSLEDPSERLLAHRSLIVLTNVCCSNRNVVNTLVGTVDVKGLIAKVSSQEASFSGISISRLLLCLGATNVHKYLGLTLNSFNSCIVEKDATQMHQAIQFVEELAIDPQYKSNMLSYQKYPEPLSKSIKCAVHLCTELNPEASSYATNTLECLENILKFVQVFVQLDLYALRSLHESVVNLCMKACLHCLPTSLHLLTSVLRQYKEEERLPSSIVSILRERLPALLVPPEPNQAGLQWLEMISCLSGCAEIEEFLEEHVTTQRFEDLLYAYLQYCLSLGTIGREPMEQAVMESLRYSLANSSSSREWYNVTTRMLANNQVKSCLRSCLSRCCDRRRNVLHLIKHPDFPVDKIESVFSEQDAHLTADSFETSGHFTNNTAQNASAGQGDVNMEIERNGFNREYAISNLIGKIESLIKDNRLSDLKTSGIIEMYNYKIACMEEHAKASNDYVNKLQQHIAQTQAYNDKQMDIFYKIQIQNERYKDQIKKLQLKVSESENAVGVLRLKLNTEREDRVKISADMMNKIKQQADSFRQDLELKTQELGEKLKALKAMEQSCKSLQAKLEEQTNKNNELGTVLVKFEERLKQRDCKLDEAKTLENALRKDLEQREQSIKQLEKTILERENRLRQTTTQLEELKRVQEMVTKLMTGQQK